MMQQLCFNFFHTDRNQEEIDMDNIVNKPPESRRSGIISIESEPRKIIEESIIFGKKQLTDGPR